MVVITDLAKGRNIQADELGEEPVEQYIYNLAGSITTNIKNSKKFVKCGISFQLNDAEEMSLLEQNSSKVRDIVNRTLKSYDEADYRQDDILDLISLSVTSSIEQQIGIESITDVFFEEFITH